MGQGDVQYEVYYLAGAAGLCVLILFIWNISLTCRIKWIWRRLRELESRNQTNLPLQPESVTNLIPRVNIRDSKPFRSQLSENRNGINPSTNTQTSAFY